MQHFFVTRILFPSSTHWASLAFRFAVWYDKARTDTSFVVTDHIQFKANWQIWQSPSTFTFHLSSFDPTILPFNVWAPSHTLLGVVWGSLRTIFLCPYFDVMLIGFPHYTITFSAHSKWDWWFFFATVIFSLRLFLLEILCMCVIVMCFSLILDSFSFLPELVFRLSSFIWKIDRLL